ncbi:MAG: hypothetical protein ACK5Q5_08975 [Planctomycetaceae bacterium]
MQKPPRLTTLYLVAAVIAVAAQLSGAWRVIAADAAGQTAIDETAADQKDQAAQQAKAQVAAEAAEMLKAARQRLFGYSSVQANLREFVALGDRRFSAEGRYVSGPYTPYPQLRLEYQVRVGNTVGTLLEVCDGQILHTERSLRRIDAAATNAEPPKPEVSVIRRDIRAIFDAISKHGVTPESMLQVELGIGGLPSLLASIERVMVFTAIEEEPLGGRNCYRLHGVWKAEYLAQLQSQFQVFGRSVQSYVPESLRIHFDAETLFPVRIAYWPPPASEGAARPPLLTLELTDIRLNEPVNATLFEYHSTGADETDTTQDYIKAIQAQPIPAPPTPVPAGAPPASDTEAAK